MSKCTIMQLPIQYGYREATIELEIIITDYYVDDAIQELCDKFKRFKESFNESNDFIPSSSECIIKTNEQFGSTSVKYKLTFSNFDNTLIFSDSTNNFIHSRIFLGEKYEKFCNSLKTCFS